MGQFKDGLDLTAIREVKYLQELRHPNVIEVRFKLYTQYVWFVLILLYHLVDRRLFAQDKPQFSVGIFGF